MRDEVKSSVNPTRSCIMASIRSQDNKSTELLFLRALRANRITGWRRRFPLCGNPDFVFTTQRVAVFVDGCFWHGCRWHCRMPKTRLDYWQPKIAHNKRRDILVARLLKSKGWRIHRIWEHSLHKPDEVIKRLLLILDKRGGQ